MGFGPAFDDRIPQNHTLVNGLNYFIIFLLFYVYMEKQSLEVLGCSLLIVI